MSCRPHPEAGSAVHVSPGLGTITRGDATQQVMSDQRSDGVTKTGPGHLTRSLTGESSGNKPSF